VLSDPLALLDDHAHLERKAAANALALIHRRPRATKSGATADAWTRTLATVARDEVEHLELVLRILRRRGGTLGRLHRNPYARALRRLVRVGRGRDELVDRLLVSALIEARSSERFEVLAAHAEDDELRRLYGGLRASERGHYRGFLDLARDLVGAEIVDARWSELLDAEAHILANQAPGPRMHSGDAHAEGAAGPTSPSS
jgi:tRNA-(ms[2]io[6]A)-hydroxylase